MTDPNDVVVSVDAEVMRFHVAIRRLMLKCTDASLRKVKKAVEAAGEGAHHTFDYDTRSGDLETGADHSASRMGATECCHPMNKNGC